MGKDNSRFETTDLTLAAFLWASGVMLLDIDHTDPRRAIFIFKQPAEELLSSFQSGKATINVLAFENAQHEIRARLYKDNRNGNR